MSSVKKMNRFENSATGYFENLPNGTKELVTELCKDTFEKHCETYTGPQVEDIECHSRDGFIAYDSNRGGVMVRGFTQLMDIFGSGTYPAHKEARKEIEGQIEYNLELLSEHVFEKFESGMKERGLTKENCNHCFFQDKSDESDDDFYTEVLRYIEDSETEFLSDDSSSIMYEVRFMYHGKLDDKHSASVSCAVNTEGPYHRSHISWAPDVFCEGAKEVEIQWTTQAELKKKLKAALDKTAKQVL